MRAAAVTIALAVTLGACAATGAHNDVLLFGTDTKVALDISTNATNGGTPEFTLGYKRREAVWMPLVVNGVDSAAIANANRQIDRRLNQCLEEADEANGVGAARVACVRQWSAEVAALDAANRPGNVQDAMYQGRTEGINSDGQTRTENDTYSVFASFGGDFSGADGGRAALAQFFATGIAAQRLGDNPRIESALSVQGAEAERVAALRETVDDLARAQHLAAGATAVQARSREVLLSVGQIVSCLSVPAHGAARTGAVNAVKEANADLKRFLEEGANPQALETDLAFTMLLENNDALVTAFNATPQVTACRSPTP